MECVKSSESNTDTEDSINMIGFLFKPRMSRKYKDWEALYSVHPEEVLTRTKSLKVSSSTK